MRRFLILLAVMSAFTGAVAQSPLYIALTDSADVCMRQERWADAERCLVEALRQEPGRFVNALLLSNLGVVRTHQGKYAEALEAFGVGLDISPRSTVLLSNRARTFMEMGDVPRAIADLTGALEVDRTLSWERKMRGLLFSFNGKNREALDDLEKYLETSPNDTDVLLAVSDILAAEGRLEESLIYCERAMKAGTPGADAYFSYALTLAQTDRLSEALSAANEGIASFPDNGNLFLVRGWINKLLYRTKESEADKKIAIDNGADIQLVHQLLGK